MLKTTCIWGKDKDKDKGYVIRGRQEVYDEEWTDGEGEDMKKERR